MARKMFILAVVLGLAACGGPPNHQSINEDPAPGMKRPVTVITPTGSTVTCVAGPGAVCVPQ